MNRIYESIDELIGGTPLFRLKAIEEKYELKCKLYAKLESFNPTGSVKARAAPIFFVKNRNKKMQCGSQNIAIFLLTKHNI